MHDQKTWSRLFRGLANLSRLKIIALLSKERELAVSDIAQRIHVSIRGTSKHLIQLAGLGILDRDGKAGHVFYSLNKSSMNSATRSIIDKFLS